jgi:hypothetical protein
MTCERVESEKQIGPQTGPETGPLNTDKQDNSGPVTNT